MKKLVRNIFLATALCFWLMACGNSTTKEPDSAEVAEDRNEGKIASEQGQDDAEFMVKAASGGLLEVELGKIAMQKASNLQVKEFARQMVNDHTKANEELKALAAQKNITIPSTPGQDHQKHLNDLSKKSGSEFDEEYMELMTKDHEEDVKLFAKAAENAKDPGIKAFAEKTLPILKTHHQAAQQVEEVAKAAHEGKEGAH